MDKNKNLLINEQPHILKGIKYVGSYNFGEKVENHYPLSINSTKKPNFLRRFICETLLIWKWIDAK